jgi:hypothetical protein
LPGGSEALFNEFRVITLPQQMRNGLTVTHCTHGWHVPVETPSANKALNLGQKSLKQHLLEPLANTLMQKAPVLWQHD